MFACLLSLQFDWVQELQRLNGEEASLDRDLSLFAAQFAEDIDEPALTTASIRLTHNKQLVPSSHLIPFTSHACHAGVVRVTQEMFRSQLGMIKLLMAHATEGIAPINQSIHRWRLSPLTTVHLQCGVHACETLLLKHRI